MVKADVQHRIPKFVVRQSQRFKQAEFFLFVNLFNKAGCGFYLVLQIIINGQQFLQYFIIGEKCCNVSCSNLIYLVEAETNEFSVLLFEVTAQPEQKIEDAVLGCYILECIEQPWLVPVYFQCMFQQGDVGKLLL